MPLAPQAPIASEGLTLLRNTKTADLFDQDRPASNEFAECVRSALFLYFSALDESHAISQNIHTEAGSYLHAIMHRQEPDYSNSKYWFRRTGRHELFPTLYEECLRLNLRSSEIEQAIQAAKQWDPFWFVDQCELAGSLSPAVTTDLETIQQLEWRLVFDYCYRRALSG